MSTIRYDPKELTIVSEAPNFFGGGSIPVFNFPVSAKEAVRALYRKEPIWQVMLGLGVECINFNPSINPDYIARAFVFDATVVPGESNLEGGKDLFGVEWVYMPEAQGSMVRPGNPMIRDANELESKLVWPDVESWDWEKAAKENVQYLSLSLSYCATLMNGFFERLISLMDFEGAVMAMVDEDQKDAVKGFFGLRRFMWCTKDSSLTSGMPVLLGFR